MKTKKTFKTEQLAKVITISVYILAMLLCAIPFFIDNDNDKEENTMYNFSSIYTGSDATDPGVLKAQADKAKRDSVAAEYKKKADAQKIKSIE